MTGTEDSNTHIANAKMDIDEFLQAAEMDDVFIQIDLRGRVSVSSMFKSEKATALKNVLNAKLPCIRVTNEQFGSSSATKRPSFPIASAVASMFGFNNKESTSEEKSAIESPYTTSTPPQIDNRGHHDANIILCHNRAKESSGETKYPRGDEKQLTAAKPATKFNSARFSET